MADLFTVDALSAALQETVDATAGAAARSRAVQYLRTHLGIEVVQDAYTLAERVQSSRTSLALRGPIVSVESVTVGSVVLVSGTDYEVTATGITCPAGLGVAAGASTSWVSVTVEYTAGFDAIPADLADAGLYLGMLAYRLGPMTGLTQEAVGSVSTTAERGIVAAGGLALPDETLAALKDAYGGRRRRRIASVSLR